MEDTTQQDDQHRHYSLWYRNAFVFAMMISAGMVATTTVFVSQRFILPHHTIFMTKMKTTNSRTVDRTHRRLGFFDIPKQQSPPHLRNQHPKPKPKPRKNRPNIYPAHQTRAGYKTVPFEEEGMHEATGYEEEKEVVAAESFNLLEHLQGKEQEMHRSEGGRNGGTDEATTSTAHDEVEEEATNDIFNLSEHLGRKGPKAHRRSEGGGKNRGGGGGQRTKKQKRHKKSSDTEEDELMSLFQHSTNEIGHAVIEPFTNQKSTSKDLEVDVAEVEQQHHLFGGLGHHGKKRQ